VTTGKSKYLLAGISTFLIFVFEVCRIGILRLEKVFGIHSITVQHAILAYSILTGTSQALHVLS
jgi:hypothetical protein